MSETRLQAARNRPLNKEVLAGQLGRLGDTYYRLEKLHSGLAGDLMIPVSELNQVRRRAIDALQKSILVNYLRDTVPEIINPLSLCNAGTDREKKPEGRTILSVWVNDLEGVIAAAENGAGLIYAGGDELTAFGVPGFRWDKTSFKEAIRQAHRCGARLIIGLPRIQRQKHLSGSGARDLQEKFGLEADGIMVSNLGALQMVLKESDLPIYLNYSLNLFNNCAIHGLMELLGKRLEQITLSPELTLEQIKGLYSRTTGPGLECIVQGPLELMVAEYCPVGSVLYRDDSCPRCPDGCVSEKDSYALRDRLNLDFPVATDQFCRMHLFNSKDLCLYEDLQALVKTGALVLRLELKIHPATEVAYLCKTYYTAIRSIEQGRWNRTGSAAVVDELIKYLGRDITKGHYFRGID